MQGYITLRAWLTLCHSHTIHKHMQKVSGDFKSNPKILFSQCNLITCFDEGINLPVNVAGLGHFVED